MIMDNNNFKKQLKTWYTNYNAYTDILQIYSDKAFQLGKDATVDKKYDNLTIVFERSTKLPVLFEFKNLYATLNIDPEEVSQDKLLDALSGLLTKYE